MKGVEMSKIKDYLLEQEECGAIVYDENNNCYVRLEEREGRL